jgi:hypothetical protein
MHTHAYYAIFRNGRFSKGGEHGSRNPGWRLCGIGSSLFKKIYLSTMLSKGNSKHPTHQASPYYSIFAIGELAHLLAY